MPIRSMATASVSLNTEALHYLLYAEKDSTVKTMFIPFDAISPPILVSGLFGQESSVFFIPFIAEAG